MPFYVKHVYKIFRDMFSTRGALFFEKGALGELFFKSYVIIVNERSQRTFALLKTSSVYQFFVLQEVLKKSLKRPQDVLEDEKLLHFIMTKTGNRFVISLNVGYVLHHCNA